MPTWYRTDDAGFPALTGTTFNMYKIIFKATLVTGYGSQPAAGWDLIDESDTHIVLRNASGGYVTLVSGTAFGSRAWAVRIYLSASYDGMLGAVPQGMGVTIGAYGHAAAAHTWGGQYAFQYKNVPTTVIADQYSCVVQAIGSAWANPSIINGASLDNSGNFSLCFGDDDRGFLIAIGGAASAPNNPYSAGFYGISALRNPGTGGFVGNATVNLGHSSWLKYTSGSGVVDSATISDAVSQTLAVEQLDLCPIRWMCNGSRGGRLRGVGFDSGLVTAQSFAVYNLLHGAGLPAASIHLGNITTPAIIDGSRYAAFPSMPSYRLGGLIMTDNPEAWSWSPA